MMKRAVTLFALIAVLLGAPFAVFILPGISERASIDKLQEKQASLEAYIELLGEPESIRSSPSEFAESYESKVFSSVTLDTGDRATYWALEGFPYYWVLVKSDAEGIEVQGGLKKGSNAKCKDR